MCPEIIVSESDGSNEIVLNDFVMNEIAGHISEIHVEQGGFVLNANEHEEKFLVRVFKIYSPRNLRSRISLVAHKREVSGSTLQKYIPEFEEEFYEKHKNGDVDHDRNYIIKAYVFSPYLDRNVSLERGGFEFGMENDLFFGILQADIEKCAADKAREAVGSEIIFRQEKKMERVQAYVDEEAPWHKEVVSKIDLTAMPYNPSAEEIESVLQREKFRQERAIKRKWTRFCRRRT